MSRNARARGVRASTISSRRLTQREMDVGRALYGPGDHERPRTRGECVSGARPCPYVGCRYHLFLDVTRAGGIKLNFPDLDVDELEVSCALDVADAGAATLEEVARRLNIVRERVRQVEAEALASAASSLMPPRRLPVVR